MNNDHRMLVQLIEQFLERNCVTFPLQCFFVDNYIEVNTNYRALYGSLKGFLEPFFKVSFTAEGLAFVKISLLTLDELQMNVLISQIDGGYPTVQRVTMGKPKFISWRTHQSGEFKISINDELRTIVVQSNSDTCRLNIICSERYSDVMLRKLLREEILYKKLLLDNAIFLNAASVVNQKDEATLIVGQYAEPVSKVLISQLQSTDFRLQACSNIFILPGNKVIGTPEKACLRAADYLDSELAAGCDLFSANGADKRESSGRLFISPKECADLLQKPLVVKSDLKMILVADGTGDEDEKFRIATSSLITPIEDSPTPWQPVISMDYGSIERNVTAVWGNIVNHIPLVQVRESMGIPHLTSGKERFI